MLVLPSKVVGVLGFFQRAISIFAGHVSMPGMPAVQLPGSQRPLPVCKALPSTSSRSNKLQLPRCPVPPSQA